MEDSDALGDIMRSMLYGPQDEETRKAQRKQLDTLGDTLFGLNADDEKENEE